MQLICIVAFLLTDKCGTLGSCDVFVIITTRIIISAPPLPKSCLPPSPLVPAARWADPSSCAGFQIKTLLLTNIQGGVGCFFENIFVFL